MRRLMYMVCVLSLCDSGGAAEPKLELALHDLAGVARKAGLKKLVIVARLDAASAAATENDLNTVEKMAISALGKEDAVEGATSDKARDTARKAKARRALTPLDAKLIKDAAACDAVIALDYRETKDRATVRIALSDGQKIQFADTVNLEQKLGGIAQLAEQKPQPGKGQPAQQGKPPAGPIGNNAGQFVPSIPAGASGYAIAMAGGNPQFVRTPNAAATAASEGKSEGSKSTNGGTKSSTSKNSTGGTGAGGTVAAGGGVAAAGSTPAPSQPGSAATEIGQKILQFSINHLGQQVGNGECWTLAAEAMKAAGAQPPDGYVFGDEIPLRSIRPGDILQFTTARFDEPGYYAVMGAPNHTAVVYSAAGDRVFILQQNFNGKRTVSTFDINLASLTSGRIQAYRARPR